MSQATIGVGVIGLGLMGRTHIQAYEAARRAGFGCKLAAVCDRDTRRLEDRVEVAGNIERGNASERLFDPTGVHTFTDPDALLADREVQLVSLCTHTDTHVDLARRALAAGKHVLVEKPVSLDAREIETLAAAARQARRIAMPAMCMRFWPGWSWLKQAIDERTYGAVRSAVFQRLASPPSWSQDFYRDSSRTGGALFDLHIHDADFVHWCFGEPESLVSTGSIDHVTTLYRYSRGPVHVVAEGGWDHSSGFPFRMRYLIVFEKATADFDLARDPVLLLHRDGTSEQVGVEAGTGYECEVRHVLAAITERKSSISPSLDEAAAVARMLAAERSSLDGHR